MESQTPVRTDQNKNKRKFVGSEESCNQSKEASSRGKSTTEEGSQLKKRKAVDRSKNTNQKKVSISLKNLDAEKSNASSTTDSGEPENSENAGASKPNNKQLKKLKQKRRLQKKKKALKKVEERKKKEENGEEIIIKRRDFSSDLMEYLERWEAYHLSVKKGEDVTSAAQQGWKFNKVLQEWALQHCLDKTAVSSELFKRLLPYLLTVQGKAKERLIEQLAKQTGDESVLDSADDSDAVLLSITKKRANRLLKLFNALDQQ